MVMSQRSTAGPYADKRDCGVLSPNDDIYITPLPLKTKGSHQAGRGQNLSNPEVVKDYGETVFTSSNMAITPTNPNSYDYRQESYRRSIQTIPAWMAKVSCSPTSS